MGVYQVFLVAKSQHGGELKLIILMHGIKEIKVALVIGVEGDQEPERVLDGVVEWLPVETRRSLGGDWRRARADCVPNHTTVTQLVHSKYTVLPL